MRCPICRKETLNGDSCLHCGTKLKVKKAGLTIYRFKLYTLIRRGIVVVMFGTFLAYKLFF